MADCSGGILKNLTPDKVGEIDFGGNAAQTWSMKPIQAYTTTEVMKILQLTREMVGSRFRSGKLVAFDAGTKANPWRTRYRFTAESLEAYIKQHSINIDLPMKPLVKEQTTYTPPEVAKMLRVMPTTVMEWIRSGELAAFNVARCRDGKRPRYRISTEAIEGFIRRRTAVPPPPVTRRRRLPPPEYEWF